MRLQSTICLHEHSHSLWRNRSCCGSRRCFVSPIFIRWSLVIVLKSRNQGYTSRSFWWKLKFRCEFWESTQTMRTSIGPSLNLLKEIGTDISWDELFFVVDFCLFIWGAGTSSTSSSSDSSFFRFSGSSDFLIYLVDLEWSRRNGESYDDLSWAFAKRATKSAFSPIFVNIHFRRIIIKLIHLRYLYHLSATPIW